MKSILISIQPQWVEKILNGEKTIEIRKTMPRCELPVKVYIYCTKGSPYLLDLRKHTHLTFNYELIDCCYQKYDKYNLNGKVVAEFTLNKVDAYYYGDLSYPIPSYEGDTSIKELPDGYFITSGDLKKCCLTYEELLKYGNKKTLYGWKIDNLKIYDEPKELSEFSLMERIPYQDNKNATYGYFKSQLTKAPQSWCYVEEV